MDVFRMVGSIALQGGKEAHRELEQFDDKGRQSSKTVERLGRMTENAGKIMKRAFVGVLAGATALGLGIGKMVKEAAEMETVSVAYEVLIGNAEKANKVIADLKMFAAKTPLGFNDITKAGQTLMAFGSASEDLQDKISMLGDLAMGNSQKLESVTRAYGKLQAKGKGSMEELNMITEAGVPILDALSKQYGVTVEELMKLVSAGKVGFEDVDRALSSLTAEGGQFFGMMEKQSQTFNGVMSSMQDNISILMSELGSKLFPLLKPLVSNITTMFERMVDSLNTEKAIAFFEKLEPKLAEFADNLSSTMRKVSAVVTFVVEVIGIVLKYMGLIFKDTFNYVKNNIINPFIDWLKAFWEQNGVTILDMVKKTWDAVALVFSVVLDNIKSIVNIFGMAFSGDWAGVWEEAKAIFTMVWEAIPTILDKAIGIIGGLGEILKNTIGGILQSMFGDEVASLYTTFVDNMVLIYTTLKDSILLIMQGFSQAFQGDWAGLWETVKTLFSTIWEAIKTIAVSTWDSLKALFEEPVMFIVGKVIELKDKVVGKVSEMFDSVVGFFSRLATSVVDSFVSMKDSIETKVSALFGSVTGFFSRLGTGITTSITTAKDNITSAVSSMVTSLVLEVSSLKTSFVNYFKTMKDNAIESVRNMVDDITEWFGETHLGKAFAWVGEQTEKVAGFFLDMWEKVTRHSYVPDMVGEIGQAFAKLKANMVDPAEEATSDVAESFEEMADDSISSLEKLWKFTSGIGSKIGGFAKGFGSEMLGSLAGGLFGGIDTGIQGFTASAEKYRGTDEDGNPEEGMNATMIGAGIGGFLMSMAQQSEQFQSLIENLQPIMDMVIDLFGRLVEPLLPLVDVLGNMLQPLLKALEPLIDVIGEMLFNMIMMLMQFIPPLISILTPILQVVVAILETVVMPVMKFIYKALAMMYNTIANAVNSLIRGINKVPGINIKWRMPTMNDNMPEYQRPAQASYDVSETEDGKKYDGGTKVSEITGPTRDLFVNLLSPLAGLNSLTGIGNRIYDLLDERLGSALGVNIGEINIYGDADVNAEALADELEEILAGRMAFAMGGNA